jgi:hypothetical protein
MFSSMSVPPRSLTPGLQQLGRRRDPIFTHDTWMLSIQPR